MSAKTRRRIIAFAIILCGVVMVNYPTLATFVNNFFAYREVGNYERQIDAMDQAQLDQEMETAQAYNRSLPMSFPADPFTEQNINKFEGTEFADFDMIQDGAVLGYIDIPKISIYQTIYYGTSKEVLDKGLGVVENSSLPVGGPGTHSVISAHSGLASRKLFTDLDKMEEGDLFFVHVLDQHFAYQVNQIKVVLPENAEDLKIEQDHDYVTLLTCTPFGINDHRLLVRGERIDYDFSQDEPGWMERQMHWFLWGLILAAGLVFLILIWRKMRKDQKNPPKPGEKPAKKKTKTKTIKRPKKKETYLPDDESRRHEQSNT